MEGTSLPGRIVITQKNTEISSTAMIATPAQIQATGGPAWVRFIVVSVLSWRSERAVSAACFGFGPYSSLVSAPTARLEGTLPPTVASRASRKAAASWYRWNGSFARARRTTVSSERGTVSLTSDGATGASLTCW